MQHNFILSCFFFFLTMVCLWQVTKMLTHIMLMRLIGPLSLKHFESFSLSALLYWKLRTGRQVLSQCTVLICCTVNICHTTEYHKFALLESCSRWMLVSSAVILLNCVSLLFADLIGLWFNNMEVMRLMSWRLIRVWCRFPIIFE